jgi:quinol monooxygenase YgiN
MADAPAKVKRVLHMKIRAVGDPAQVLALMKGGSQFFSALGGARFRYLRNVDDPAQFVVEVEYEADAALELNHQKVASDPMVRAFLQGWKQMLAGQADMDVYEDVTG